MRSLKHAPEENDRSVPRSNQTEDLVPLGSIVTGPYIVALTSVYTCGGRLRNEEKAEKDWANRGKKATSYNEPPFLD